MKYCRFYKIHNHTTNDCIYLKDMIKGVIKRDIMYEYIEDGKRDREESPKSKFPANMVDVGTNRKKERKEEKGENKRKLQHIGAIIGGAAGKHPVQGDNGEECSIFIGHQ